MGTELFNQAKPILEKIEQHGFEAYFVGGWVRDYLMNRHIHDIDITTSATPDEIESIFEKTIPIGREHGTINVVYQGTNYEVTTFRAEAEYVDHRRPSEVYFVRDLKKIYNVVTLQLMQLPWIKILIFMTILKVM